MLQIKDKLVSLDIVEKYFSCRLEKCLGQCCIDGDAGAPITNEEYRKICDILPLVYDRLSPAAQEVLQKQGAAYYDEDGDLVTSIVDGRDCVFTTYAPGGICLCALEQIFREGKSTFRKPQSCALYPIRAKEYTGFTALNYHHWKICKSAEKAGKTNGIRVFQFLKEPLIEAYGKEWYDELETTALEYLSQAERL